ncbi:ABC transporter substrate-binding protein [Methanobacterium sp. SMA-27]|uniref:ABC transporter substrate-binding protein n=1 Tax=Methanobacterium sp. SMA-27 TaxID=1495336 RepID=UPI00064EE420|nr:ABC transporter substrate-binding protein [Methanobacterium sp. SMA-27]
MNNKKIVIISLIGIIVVIGTLYVYTHYNTDNSSISEGHISDMGGRSVQIPPQINKIASLSYSVTVEIYMLAPDKLVGWDSNRTTAENLYMPIKYQNLPIMGGGKKDANYETYLSKDPDVVFVGHGGSIDDINKLQEKLGSVPLLDVEGDNNITSLPESIKFLGTALGENEKSIELISFYDNVLNKVNSTSSTIPDTEKKRVYYARDSTGLMTNPEGSTHTQLIELSGGINVAQVPLTKGSIGVSMEQILDWNPDVIIASDPSFYNNVYSNPLWQNVKAVKDKQVYLVPNSPFNWFEGPPGANTIIGIPWTAKVLYPDKFKDIDLKNLTKEYYSNFYHFNLTDDQVYNILSSSGLKEF